MSPWIISRRQDLLWFHGSVVAGLLLLLLFRLCPPLSDANYSAAHPAVLLLLAWGGLFDGTHVLGTYARTYLAPTADRDARRALPPRTAWLILPAGPLLALVDGLLLPQRPSLLGHAGALFQHALLLAYLWAYYHLVRQHYGFLALYTRRCAHATARDLRIDTALLWIGCLYPYLRYSLSPAYAHSGLPQLLPSAALPTLRSLLDGLAAGCLLLLLPAYVARLRRHPLGPRELLLGVVIAFHLLVFALLDHLLTITATLTLFHNLQYHRIVAQYERGKGRTPLQGWGTYLGAGVLLGVLWYGPRILGVALLPPSMWRNALLGLGWGVALHHYWVDGRIWRVRRTSTVAATLDRAAQPTPSGAPHA